MKLKNLFIVSVFAALFMGCSLGSQIFPPTIYSPKAIEQLTADLKEISKNYQIEEIRVDEKESLSNEFGFVRVDMRDSEGQRFEQVLYYNYGISHNDPKPKKEYGSKRKKEPHAINVEDIINQKDNIEKYIEDAKVQLEENLEGKYKFESVTHLTFTADDEGNLQTKFSVNVTEKGKADRREGGRLVTDYYELKFFVDKDGDVVYKD
ncbi:MAG: hypothetical protein LBI82_11265 [Dysgonamonadaceae bacterium]|jgi:hypothetical protein|nr:hypothetical protein [Dysgonamonadaceae bacterium]